MHALYILSRREVKLTDESVLPVTEKESNEEGKWSISPRMTNRSTNRTLSSISFTSVLYPLKKIKCMHRDVMLASFCKGSKEAKARTPTVSLFLGYINNVIVTPCSVSLAIRQKPDKTGYLT